MLRALLPATLLSLLIHGSVVANSYGPMEVIQVLSVEGPGLYLMDIDELPPIIGHDIPVLLKDIDLPRINAKCRKERKLALRGRKWVRKYIT